MDNKQIKNIEFKELLKRRKKETLKVSKLRKEYQSIYPTKLIFNLCYLNLPKSTSSQKG